MIRNLDFEYEVFRVNLRENLPRDLEMLDKRNNQFSLEDVWNERSREREKLGMEKRFNKVEAFSKSIKLKNLEEIMCCSSLWGHDIFLRPPTRETAIPWFIHNSVICRTKIAPVLMR